MSGEIDAEAPGVGHHHQLIVGERVAVHEGHRRTEQAGGRELGDRPVAAPFAVARVAADPQPELVREPPVLLGDLHRRELVAARREAQRHERVVGRQPPVAQAAHILGRVRERADRLPVPVSPAVTEDDPRPGLVERVERGVGVLRGVQVVRPVKQRGDPRIERLERADQVSGVGVGRPVQAAQRAVQAGEVVGQRPVGGDVAKQRLPGVAMGVDQPGQHEAVGGVDDLGVTDAEVCADGDDRAILDQHLAGVEIPELGVDRDDGTALDQRALSHACRSRGGGELVQCAVEEASVALPLPCAVGKSAPRT
jgi:hypothetical protein